MRPTSAGTLLNSEMTASGTIEKWMSTAAGPPESGSRKVSNIREDNNIMQGHQQQHQELTTRTLTTAAETKGTSQMSTQKGDPQQQRCQK
jgi:hypothetical protein